MQMLLVWSLTEIDANQPDKVKLYYIDNWYILFQNVRSADKKITQLSLVVKSVIEQPVAILNCKLDNSSC